MLRPPAAMVATEWEWERQQILEDGKPDLIVVAKVSSRRTYRGRDTNPSQTLTAGNEVRK
jgi:hypothetical protein